MSNFKNWQDLHLFKISLLLEGKSQSKTGHIMNNMQQIHAKIFIAVLGVLGNFKTIWQIVEAFASARNAPSVAACDIRTEELKQSGTTGISENKRLARQAMCSAAAVAGSPVAAWSETQGKHDLVDTVDFSVRELPHHTEDNCLTNYIAI